MGEIVYIIYNSYTRLSKIGITKRVNDRVEALERANGVELDVYFTTPPIRNAYKVEQSIHKRYASNRRLGEWFDVDRHKIRKSLEGLIDKSKIDKLWLLRQSGSTFAELADMEGCSSQAIQKRFSYWVYKRKTDGKQDVCLPPVEKQDRSDGKKLSKTAIELMVQRQKEKNKTTPKGVDKMTK